MLGVDPAVNLVAEYAKKCVRCGQCRSVCPIFFEMRTEGFSPRARVFLAELVHRACKEEPGQSAGQSGAGDSGPGVGEGSGPAAVGGMGAGLDADTRAGKPADHGSKGRCDAGPRDENGELVDNSELIDKAWDRMLSCLLCRGCSADCPSGVPVDDIIVAARKEYIGCRGKPPAIKELGHRFLETHNVAGDANANRLLWMEGLDSADQVPHVGVSGGAPDALVYFMGCVSSLYPGAYKIPRALTRIMNRAGIKFAVLGGEEWCCGYPLAVLGLQEEAEEMARHNVEKVKSLGAQRVLTSCPSCYYMWKHVGKRAGTELEVIHYTTLLHEVVAAGKVELGSREVVATYHDPCDLGRKCGVYDPPREVLARIPGLVFKEMANSRQNARCCGGGGNLEMNNPDLSARVARSRLVQAADTGATLIVTACQQCARTLARAAQKTRVLRTGAAGAGGQKVGNAGSAVPSMERLPGITVKDIAELAWEAMLPGTSSS